MSFNAESADLRMAFPKADGAEGPLMSSSLNRICSQYLRSPSMNILNSLHPRSRYVTV